MANITVALDAGHGGSDPGAVYGSRMEKDDALKLTLAVGKILEQNGINVFYVRNSDEYETPFKKATDANNSKANYLVSIHRNSSETPNKYDGIETLVYNNTGTRNTLATNINKELEKIGFKNNGITNRPNLVVLKRSKMPAALVEVGFINNDRDNSLFDEKFNSIADAIAKGILITIGKSSSRKVNENISNDYSPTNPQKSIADNPIVNAISNTPSNLYDNNNNVIPIMEMTDNYNEENETNQPLYRIQVGAYKNKENADRMLNSLLVEGFPAFMIYEDGYYKVQAGAFIYLTNAIKLERRLRRFRYNTYIVYN